MNRFEVVTDKQARHGPATILRDLHTKASATILTGLGANCMQLSLSPDQDSPAVPVINDLPHAGKLKTMPFRFGIPILFPWASGIPNGEFMFANELVELNEPGVRKSTHHGFVYDVPWRVLHSGADSTGAWITCGLTHAECTHPYAKRFRFPFELEFTWKLTARNFVMDMRARNTGQGPMPMGLGLHPYFTLPLGKQGSRASNRLRVDAERQWNLPAIMDVEPHEPPVPDPYLPKLEFDPTANEGRPLGDTAFNHVYDARFDRDMTAASVIDVADGLRLDVRASKDFGTWVIYSPNDRQVISLEPWTMVPNAFNLSAAGQKNTGMITLPPGQQWQGSVEFLLTRI